MKAISVKQPWAWAILHAGKDIENRSWLTRFRGDLAIHATAPRPVEGRWPRGVRRPTDDELQVSAIIGVVELVDVVEASSSRWFEGPFGFVLANPRPLPEPIPCKGALMLWAVPRRVEKLIRRQIPGLKIAPPPSRLVSPA